MSDQRQAGDKVSEACVLVVDDQATTRAIHKALLERQQYQVVVAASGDEALSLCMERLPDLVLLDVEMPGLNGFETCRSLLAHFDVPIIFVTAHDELEEHLKAYDAGGVDLIVKPVSAEILMRKVSLAVGQHRERKSLHAETNSLRSAAQASQSSVGESHILLDFTRAALACRNFEALAQLCLEAVARLGVQACVALRHADGVTMRTSRGEATGLELSVLEQSFKMGRMFRFKRRLAINFRTVSMVVLDLPEDELAATRLCDSLLALCETAEALAENVAMRRESAARAEQMQLALAQASMSMAEVSEAYQRMVAQVRLTMSLLSEEVEQTYSWLATDRATESRIAGVFHMHVESILSTLMNGSTVGDRLENIAQILRGQDGGDVELF